MFKFSALPKRWINVTAPVCAVVAAVGQLLKTHFPPRADQANELTDRPLLLSRGRARRVAH
jgi:uncharacterized membrane protein